MPLRIRLTSLICAALAPMCAGSARAQESVPEAEVQPRANQTLRFTLENDMLDRFGPHTDRYYTNGLRIDWESDQRRPDSDFLPGITHADWCRVVCGRNPGDVAFSAGFAVGQNMYTPRVIVEPRSQPFDRPWGGVAYLSRHATATFRLTERVERQERIEATVGMIGPVAQSGAIQKWWHSLFPSWPQPQGWHNQLRNEPVVQLQYGTARRIQLNQGNNFDLIPRARGNLGSMLVSAEVEATLRAGRNLKGFGAPAPQPLAPPPAPDRKATDLGAMARGGGFLSSFNLFGRASLKAVAHNIFLDGNLFARNDIRIRRRPIVPELAGGFEVQLARRSSLTYQYVHRFSEFRSRPFGNAPAQNFGAATLAFHW